MADIEQRLREWLAGPESSEMGGCYVLSPGSASDLLDAIEEGRANAAELVAANWRNIAEKDAELQVLRDQLKRLRNADASAESRDQLDETMARARTAAITEPLSADELQAYKQLPARERHLLAVEVARQLLADPDLRHAVEVEMREQQGISRRSGSLRNAQEMFLIGADPGRIWVWINGLKTYGEGETWPEAHNDTLDEIGYALQELWEAREATDNDKRGEEQ